MRIHIGGDHAAYELHQSLVTHLRDGGHDVVDHGPYDYDAEDDYPVFVLRAAEAVAADPGSLGVVLGGSGNGEQMAANKVAGIRAALAYSAELAQPGARAQQRPGRLDRGAGSRRPSVAKEIVDAFVATEFTGEARHGRRLGYGVRVRGRRETSAGSAGLGRADRAAQRRCAGSRRTGAGWPNAPLSARHAMIAGTHRRGPQRPRRRASRLMGAAVSGVRGAPGPRC